MDSPPGGQRAAAIRAARHWKRLDKKPFGALIGLSERQVGRIESGNAKIDPDLLPRIAEVTGVPLWFLDHGFRPPATAIANAEAATLRSELRDLAEQVDLLMEWRSEQLVAAAEATARTDASGQPTSRSQQGPPQ